MDIQLVVVWGLDSSGKPLDRCALTRGAAIGDAPLNHEKEQRQHLLAIAHRSDIANHPSEHVANRREEFERVLDDGDARHGDSSALPLDWPWVPLSHDGTTVATKP